MAHSGYDAFFAAPGTQKSMNCRVCGTECTVTRNVLGATSWAEAMGQRKHEHDSFICPHSEKKWHETALQLCQEIEKTASRSIAAIMHRDLQEIIEENLGEKKK